MTTSEKRKILILLEDIQSLIPAGPTNLPVKFAVGRAIHTVKAMPERTPRPKGH